MQNTGRNFCRHLAGFFFEVCARGGGLCGNVQFGSFDQPITIQVNSAGVVLAALGVEPVAANPNWGGKYVESANPIVAGENGVYPRYGEYDAAALTL